MPRKQSDRKESAVPKAIKTTVQLSPETYEKLHAWVARRRSKGERVDVSKFVGRVLEERLRDVSVQIRGAADLPGESAA